MFRLLALLMLVLALMAPTGCVSLEATPRQDPYADRPFRLNRFDFQTAWKTTPSPQGLTVDLVLKNVRYMLVNDLSLDMELLSRDGKVISRGGDVLSGSLRDGESGEMRVLLPNAQAAPGDRLHFKLSYNGIEGSVAHRPVSDFTVDAATGAPIVDNSER